ncbi:MAG: hypothetical protein E7664_04435 [Ruminococcaceae bacterium]|nr:hypothetical protein [Oscillospiraceae bacterium]
MAVGYSNESYERCISELRARYTGRGFCVAVQKNAAAQDAEHAKLLPEREESVSFHRGSGITDAYRSGEYNGSKYMTSDDFVRYFRNRRTFNMPSALVSAKQKAMEAKGEQAENGALTRRSGNARGGAVTTAEASAKEGHLASRLETFVKKWFPAEIREGRTEGGRFRLPTAAMGSVAAFALSLGLIVSGSVMIGSASGEVGALNSEIARLEAQQTELQSKLDLKYNIQDIEAEAKSLGMINKEFAEGEYIEVGDDEVIEFYEQEEKNVGIAALLSAFGIRLD